MTFVCLALCLAAGISMRDAGPAGLPAAGTPVLLGLLCLILLGAWIRRGRSGRLEARVLRGLALLVAGAVLFDLGSRGLEAKLASAAEDARRAAAVGTPHRIVDADVVGRRAGRWADEVELAGVRAADGGVVPPSRILLRVPRFGRPPPGARKGAERAGEALDPAPEKVGSGISVPTRADALLWPGARVRLGVRIAPLFFARNPGAPARARSAARRGWAARGRLVDPAWVVSLDGGEAGWVSWAARAHGWRARLRSRVAERLAPFGEGAALARALALGDRGGLSGATREAFSSCGLGHLIAVSGLHVGLVAGVVGWLGLRSGLLGRVPTLDPLLVTLGVGAATAGLYTWLTGAGVASQRAWWGFVAVGLIGRFGGPRAPLPLLASVATVMVLVEPALLFDLGARLSFAACGALIAAGAWRHPGEPRGSSSLRLPSAGWPGRLAAALFDGARASLFVSTAASFGVVLVLANESLISTWLAPLCNLVAVPWLGLVALPGALAAIGIAWLGPNGPVVDLALRFALWPSEILSLGIVEAAARLPPGPTFFVDSLWPIGLGAVGGLALLRSGRIVPALALWCLVSTWVPLPAPALVALGERMGLWIFDVGQGDAALLVGRQAAVLVDTGPGSPDGGGGRALVRTLRALGHRRLDLVVVTHGDLDHRGGARRVLEELEVDTLWMPRPGRTDPILRKLEEQARRAGTAVVWTDAEQASWLRGGLALEVLWPPRVGAPDSRNDASLVIRAVLDETSVLLTADAGEAVEGELLRTRRPRLAADVLKVSHHGSGQGSTAAFLAAVAPAHAIVSAPCLPTRGLPHRGALERIRAVVPQLWWTGRDGAVFVDLGSGSLQTPAMSAASASDAPDIPRAPDAVGGRGRLRARGHGLRVSGWGTPRDCEGGALARRPNVP